MFMTRHTLTGDIGSDGVAPYGEIVLMSGEKRLNISALDLKASVVGSVASCELELVFSNPYGLLAEGELELPLTDTSTVCGFAFEYNGKMIPASVVEKKKAKQVFEAEVRAGKSTALVEHVKGNSFKTRVYPITDSKKIKVEFTCELESHEDGTQHLALPWNVPEDIDLSASIGVAMREDSDVPKIHSNVAFDAKVSSDGTMWSASASGKTALKSLDVCIPPVADDTIPLVAVSTWEQTFTGEEDTIVMIDDVAPMDDSDSSSSPAKHPLILWDASYSFVEANRERELKLLSQLMEGVKKCTVVVFRNVADQPKTFTSYKSVKEYLTGPSAVHDGGTDLGRVLLQVHQHSSELLSSVDHIWLFTDGLSTIGNNVPEVPNDCELNAQINIFVSSTSKSAKKALSCWAEDTGGALYSANAFSRAASIIRKQKRLQWLGVACKDGVLSQVYPHRPQLIRSEGEHVVVTGKLSEGVKETELVIQYGYSKEDILCERTITITSKESQEFSIIPRVWAKRKVDHLLEAGDEDPKVRKQVLDVARNYGIVSPGASLLVLTDLESFIKHDIEPNMELLPEIYDAWDQNRREEEKSAAQKKDAKLTKVKGWWDTRMQWYKKDCQSVHKQRHGPKFKAEYEKAHPLGFTPKSSDPPALPKEPPAELRVKPLSKEEAKKQAKARKSAPKRSRKARDKSSGAVLRKEEAQLSSRRSSRESKLCEMDAMQSLEASKISMLNEIQSSSSSSMAKMKISSLAKKRKRKAKPAMKMAMMEDMCGDDDDDSMCEEEEMAFDGFACAGGAPPPAPCAASAAAPPPPPGGGGGGKGGPSGKMGKSADKKTPPPGAGGATVTVKLDSWSPDRPYLNAIKAAGDSPQAQYSAYLAQRSGENAFLPAFFLDVSTHFFDQARLHGESCSNEAAKGDGKEEAAEKDKKKKKKKKTPMGGSPTSFFSLGCRILTCLCEIKLEDQRLIRITGNRLWQENVLHTARWLLRKVKDMCQEEPQSHRELGMVCSDMGDYQLAWDNLWHVIETEWERRFQHIEDEVLWELQRTLWLAEKKGITVDTSACPSDMFKKYLMKDKRSPMDVRLNIAWDTDDCCIDLHIIQPNGTKCYYGHYNTAIGGWSTPDYSGCTAYSTSMIREYTLKMGMPGEYKLGCNYYSRARQDLLGASTIWFTIWTNYMTENESRQRVVSRLESTNTSYGGSSTATIGSMSYASNPTYALWEEEWADEIEKRNDVHRARKAKWDVYEKEKGRIDALWTAFNAKEEKVRAKNEALIASFSK